MPLRGKRGDCDRRLSQVGDRRLGQLASGRAAGRACPLGTATGLDRRGRSNPLHIQRDRDQFLARVLAYPLGIVAALGAESMNIDIQSRSPFKSPNWQAMTKQGNMHRATPKPILDKVKEVFGGEIGLDPCGCPGDLVGAKRSYRLPERALDLYAQIEAIKSNKKFDDKKKKALTLKAKQELSAILNDDDTENGLRRSWVGFGNTFCNPPYGREIGRWGLWGTSQFRRGYPREQLIFLVPSECGANWYQDIYFEGCDSALQWKGRLKFGPDFETPAPFWSSLFYLGDHVASFRKVFAGMGTFIK